MPLARMDAELVANGDVDALIAKLTELGFSLEVIHWAEKDVGTTIVAAIFTELDVDGFFELIEGILAPFNAIDPNNIFLYEAGMVQRPSRLGAPGVVKRSYLSLG